MARFVYSTILSLASLLLLAASQAQTAAAVAVAPNMFQDPQPLDAREHRRLNSGHYTDSPFSSGCVGTSSLCAVALSRASVTEQETIHKDAIPSLWKDKDDVEYWEDYNLSNPSQRMKKFFERLGGEEWSFKRQLSQAELQRLLQQAEHKGEQKRQKLLAAFKELQEKEAAAHRLQYNPDRSTPAKSYSSPAKVGGSSRRRPALKTSSPARPARAVAFAAVKGKMLKKRALPAADEKPVERNIEEGEDNESEERSEDDDFHALLRQRFSRPYDSA